MSEKLETGTIVEGKVVRVKPFGAIVACENGSQGLVHISQIANNFVQNITDHVNVGDTVKVKVLSIDEESGKISLSMKEALPPQPKRPSNFNRSRDQKNNFDNRSSKPTDKETTATSPNSDFEDKMKEWLKQSNERQTSLNKRNNRR